MRNRLLWLSLLMVAISFAMVEFIGDLAITEQRATQVAILAAFLRLGAVIMVALFVVVSSLRELQDKTLEMILAMPIHRASYYAGKLLGYIQVALLVTVIVTSLLLLYAPAAQVVIWGTSLFLELVLVIALGLVMLFSFHQVPAALAGVFLFYAAARSITSIVLMSKYPMIPNDSLGQTFLDAFVEALSWLLPDLQHFTRTEWLVYGDADWGQLLPVLAQTTIYAALLSAIALFDFYRKNF